MSHHIYQTKAYVIEGVDSGEANKRLLLLTEDLGLIVVAAQGVRLGVSKLKASIQDFSYVRVSVVRGKEVWRLTNAEKLISLYDKRLPISVKRVLIEALMFVKRLTPTDVHLKEVFDVMSSLSSYCFESKNEAVLYTEEALMYFKVHILSLLGYGLVDDVAKKICAVDVINTEILSHIKEHTDLLRKSVDKALLESHL